RGIGPMVRVEHMDFRSNFAIHHVEPPTRRCCTTDTYGEVGFHFQHAAQRELEVGVMGSCFGSCKLQGMTALSQHGPTSVAREANDPVESGRRESRTQVQ